MEITANTIQKVVSNDNVLFTTTVVPGNCSIIHVEDSGLVTLRGLPNGQRRARFRVTFTGNMKANADETIIGVTLLSLAASRDGETIPTSTMTITVGDTTSTYSVGTEFLVDVPIGCCTTIAIKNITSGIDIDIQNANLIVERVA
jgi:hypothetical protein